MNQDFLGNNTTTDNTRIGNMFTDKTMSKQCPQMSNPDFVCHRSLIYQALHGVELSYDSTFKLDCIIKEVCDFCVKQNNGR